MTDAPQSTRRPRLSPGFWHVVGAIALVALTAGTFSNALQNEFVNFDDWPLIEHNVQIRSLAWDNVGRMFTELSTNQAWLPLRVLSYAVDYHFWGLNAFGYHLTNLVLHTANVLLVYAVLRWIVGRGLMAWLGAACFAVHPVQVESVTWASGRRDVLYAFFFLLSLLSFLRYLRGGKWRRWCYGASVAFFVLAMLSKASAMMLPALLVLIVLLYEEHGEDPWRRVWACMPHAVISAALVGAHLYIAHAAKVVKTTALGQRVASMPWIFAQYWRLLFFPVALSTPHARPPLAFGTDGGLIAATLLAAVAVPLLAWWAAPRRRTALLCLGWWFILLLPVSQLIPLSMLVAERYLYVPLIGACAFGAELLGWLGKERRRRVVVVACAGAVVALFAVTTHARNRVWRNSRTFWWDGVSKWPAAPVPRIGLAAVYLERGRPDWAWEQYMSILTRGGMAWSEHPEHHKIVRTGVLLSYDRVARRREAAGRQEEAVRIYEKAATLWPKRVDVHVRLAEVYERRGMREAARAQVARTRRLYDEQRQEHPEEFQKLNARFPWIRDWLRRRGGPGA